ncbi:MAG: hypothetical protein JWP25_9011 [Bradyrhizobium sp.]|nr:hypothetical protein [Bradyrhizobium sp.]
MTAALWATQNALALDALLGAIVVAASAFAATRH